VDILLDRLLELGLTKQLRAKEDGMYTWLKLLEWLQVDFTQIFGNNLEHTPWFRFPFGAFLEVYFKLLKEETSIVMKKYGAKETLFSSAFLQIGLFPFVMTAVSSAQMMLMAAPINALGANGDAQDALGVKGFGEYNPANMKEEVVLHLPHATEDVDWQKVDSRVTGRRLAKGLFLLEMPTFRPLTEILKSIALYSQSARVLEISNQRELQVRVQYQDTGNSSPVNFSSLQGVKVLFKYKYPTDGTQNEPATSVALAVLVPFLLATIRTCHDNGVDVMQIYDSWGG